MYEYSMKYFGVDHLVVTIHPKDEFFYRSLLLFKRIPATGVVDYLGAPAIALHLDLEEANREYFKNYEKCSGPKNLHHFFTEKELPNLIFPERAFNLIADPFVTAECYENLFLKKLGMGQEIMGLLNGALKDKELYERESPRLEVDLTTILSLPSDESISHLGKAKDVSLNGFRFFTTQELPLNETFACKIKVRRNHVANVSAKIMWRDENRGYGCLIQQSDENWNDFINYLYQVHKDKVS